MLEDRIESIDSTQVARRLSKATHFRLVCSPDQPKNDREPNSSLTEQPTMTDAQAARSIRIRGNPKYRNQRQPKVSGSGTPKHQNREAWWWREVRDASP